MTRLRHFGQLLLLLTIMLLWSAGIAEVLALSWTRLFLSFLGLGVICFLLHYYWGDRWLIKQLGGRPVNRQLFDDLQRRAGLEGDFITFFVTKPLNQANAFTVTCAGSHLIFLTPEVWRSKDRLLAPIVAHELAHIKNSDSLIAGFISNFEQIISNMGNLWMFLLFAGPIGWIILLFGWPIILFVHLWSHVTLLVYKPLSALISRNREFEADRRAARWTSPEAMMTALQALTSYNRSWYEELLSPGSGPLSSHPDLDARISNLKQVHQDGDLK